MSRIHRPCSKEKRKESITKSWNLNKYSFCKLSHLTTSTLRTARCLLLGQKSVKCSAKVHQNHSFSSSNHQSKTYQSMRTNNNYSPRLHLQCRFNCTLNSCSNRHLNTFWAAGPRSPKDIKTNFWISLKSRRLASSTGTASSILPCLLHQVSKRHLESAWF